MSSEDLPPYIDARAVVDPGAWSERGTRVWGFVHTFGGAAVGCDCNICEQVLIEDQVAIGDRVTVKCGVQRWDGVVLEDDVFVGPNATFTNDPFPRSRQYLKEYPKNIVGMGPSIRVNASALPRVTGGLVSISRHSSGVTSIV